MRVLLVEDDPEIGSLVQEGLRDAAYAADWISDGGSVVQILDYQHYDMVLLDLGLPGKGGLSILNAVRARGNPVPMLVITGRDGLDERLQCLDGGADDCVGKPFEMAELLARMRAVARRKHGSAKLSLSNGALTLDPSTYRAQVDGAPAVQLSSREFALLQALMARPAAILSRSELETRVYGRDSTVDSNAIEFLIHALRKKLGRDAIRNVRGVGWTVGGER